MNAFLRHHLPAIALRYHCFDRILCNAYLQPFLWTAAAARFLLHRRHPKALNQRYLRGIANEYHTWFDDQVTQFGWPVITPDGDVPRQQLVEPYYQQLGTAAGIAVILKCRESARVIVSDAAGHLERVSRFVKLYYFYLLDPQLGRLFIRMCPYFPFNAQVYLNGHEWLAGQLRAEGIGFRKYDNLFVACDRPARLQELADAFSPAHIDTAIAPWLARFLPYFTDAERAAGYRHRLYLAQVEYCDNLIFHRAADLDRLFSRLLDSNRTIGHPDKLAVIFGRSRFQPETERGRTQIKLGPAKTMMLRTGFHNTSVKQYVKSGVGLRTETTCQQLQDLALPKAIANLPKVRQVLSTSNERYQDAQQDILASFIDRGQMQQLRQATVSPSGRRTPGLRVNDPRLLAVLHALTSFAYVVGYACFRTTELLDDVRRTLNRPDYRLSQLRYDLSKLRAKGLVQRLPATQRYQLSSDGYRLAVLYQKLSDRLYGPLTAAIIEPVAADRLIGNARKSKLDRCYEAVDQALQDLTAQVGIVAA
jgi:hypothetical protein